MKSISRITMLVTALAILIAGCAQYQITQPLEQPLTQPTAISVGTIEDLLPPETPENKKPTIENIDKFKTGLTKYLVKEKVAMETFATDAVSETFEVRGSVLAYKKGSGALRFFVGFGAGNAKLTTHLELVQAATGKAVFAGNFTGEVSDWSVKGDKMWDNVAKNFAKALKKQVKLLATSKKS